MLMVTLILVCSMGAVSVSAATKGYDLDVDGDGNVNVVVMGGHNTHYYGTDVTANNAWHGRLITLLNAYTGESDKALYGKTINTYVLGSESDTSVDGALKVVHEAVALNPDLVILEYASADFRYLSSSYTTNEIKEYFEKIILTLAEAENVPYFWNIQLPNKNTGYDRAIHNAQVVAKHGATKNSGFISGSSTVQELNSQHLEEAACWDENGNLTWEGHKRIGAALQQDFKNVWTNGTGLTKISVGNLAVAGNTPVYGTFKAANTAVASEGFEAQSDGSMVSTAADATLTLTLTGRTFGVVHDVAGADYEISIGNGINYRAVDCSAQPVHYKEGYDNNAIFKVRIKATAPGVKIKGFYESPIAITEGASADGKVTAKILNSSLAGSETIPCAMVAFYDNNNKFIGISTPEWNGSVNSFAVEENALPGAAKAKVVVWNSLESLKPLCDATDFITLN